MDGSRAIYKSGRTMNPSNGAISAYAAPVREFLTDIESSFLRVLKYAGHEDEEYPLHIIQLHGVFNDARLPGFSVDIEKREIEFDWRGLLSRLFREEVFAAAEPDAIEVSTIRILRDFSAKSYLDIWGSKRSISSRLLIYVSPLMYLQESKSCRKTSARSSVKFVSMAGWTRSSTVVYHQPWHVVRSSRYTTRNMHCLFKMLASVWGRFRTDGGNRDDGIDW